MSAGFVGHAARVWPKVAAAVAAEDAWGRLEREDDEDDSVGAGGGEDAGEGVVDAADKGGLGGSELEALAVHANVCKLRGGKACERCVRANDDDDDGELDDANDDDENDAIRPPTEAEADEGVAATLGDNADDDGCEASEVSSKVSNCCRRR